MKFGFIVGFYYLFVLLFVFRMISTHALMVGGIVCTLSNYKMRTDETNAYWNKLIMNNKLYKELSTRNHESDVFAILNKYSSIELLEYLKLLLPIVEIDPYCKEDKNIIRLTSIIKIISNDIKTETNGDSNNLKLLNDNQQLKNENVKLKSELDAIKSIINKT